jgi:integrase
MNHLEPNELISLLRAAKAKSTRNWCLLLTGFCHGLRASELSNLKLADVDLRLETIRIRRLKHSLETVQAIHRHPGVPLLDELAALKQWLKTRPGDGSDFLFNSRKGGRIDRRAIYKLFRSCAVTAGLPEGKRNPHILKHSAATILAQQGASPFAIRQHLGHRSLSSTLRYTSISDAEAGKIAALALMAAF